MASNPQRISELQRELAANPGSRQFYQLGELLRREGRAAEAATVLRGGLGFHPRYVAAWVSLGRCYLEAGQAAHAVEALDAALGLDQSNPVAWRLLGEARLMLGSRLGALDAMQRALELAPGDDVLQAAVESLASATAPPEPGFVPPPAVAEPVPQPPATAVAELPPPAPEEAASVVPLGPPAVAESLVSRSMPVVPAAPRIEPRQVVRAPSTRPYQELDDPFALTGSFGPDAVPASDVFAEPVVAAPAVEPALDDAFEGTPALEGAAPLEAAPPPEAAVGEAPEFGEPAQTETAAESMTEEPAPAAAVLEAEPPAAEEEPAAVAEVVPFPTPPQAPVAEPPASITLARLLIQQQHLDAAIAMLERLLHSDAENQEARDLLELVRDMLEPMPAALPPLSVRERKIAALQRWLASITLARERIRT